MGEFAMKTVTAVVTITEKMLQDYEAIFGKQVRIPPTFPMFFTAKSKCHGITKARQYTENNRVHVMLSSRLENDTAV